MRNIKLVIEYDGTDFEGWQVQPRARTVQAELQQALGRLLQERCKVVGSGRTDSGVHALGQVANFRSSTRLALNSIRDGLNSYLPPDIRVLQAQEAAPSFHARYDARSRLYRYIISRKPRAVGRQYAWHCRYELDVANMRAASRLLLGSHAFIAFAKKNPAEEHYLCDVHSLEWFEGADELRMEICANRFLHKMVRMIVGTLVDVGRGRLQPNDVRDMLEQGEQAQAGSAAPAHGLFLVQVTY